MTHVFTDWRTHKQDICRRVGGGREAAKILVLNAGNEYGDLANNVVHNAIIDFEVHHLL